MILTESHSANWLEEVKTKFPKKDPALIEKVIRALTLLEELQAIGLDFIFKGGTSLILILKSPQRFSIDIDVLMSKIPADLEDRFSKIVERGKFTKFEEDDRKYKGKIPKKHYKFFYNSVLTGAGKHPPYVLLDILEQKSSYPKHFKAKIESPFVKTDANLTEVLTPTVDSILGDKLTAFAPKTTGIRFNADKDLEIIKQLFDISHLFDEFAEIEIFNESFRLTAKYELEYRELTGKSHNDVLLDSLEAAETLAFQGRIRPDEFKWLQNGVNGFSSYVFSKKFSMDNAVLCAGKVAYLVMGTLKDAKKFQRFTAPAEVGPFTISHADYTSLNKLKKINPEAFFYWYHASLLKVP